MLGMSLGAVQRALQRRAQKAPLDFSDDDDDDDDPVPVGQVRSIGADPVDPRVELFEDERGRRFNQLDLYRAGRVRALENAKRLKTGPSESW